MIVALDSIRWMLSFLGFISCIMQWTRNFILPLFSYIYHECICSPTFILLLTRKKIISSIIILWNEHDFETILSSSLKKIHIFMKRFDGKFSSKVIFTFDFFFSLYFCGFNCVHFQPTNHFQSLLVRSIEIINSVQSYILKVILHK